MSLIKKLASLPQSLGLVPTPDGAFTLKEGGIFVHSARAPLAEASRLLEGHLPSKIEGCVVILWGMGLGYHAELLINQGFRVIGIETRPRCVEALRGAFPLDKLCAFITESPEDHIFSILAALPSEDAQNFADIILRGCEPSPKARILEDKAKRAQQSSNRIYSFLMDAWYHHILINLADIPILAAYTENAFAGLPVLVCSAGPSLRESLPHIRKIRSKVALIAVDTALSALLEAGVTPDFLHAVDAKVHNVGDFAGIPDRVFSEIVLLADLTLSPLIAQKPWKHIEILMTVHPVSTPSEGFHLKSIALLEHLRSLGLNICGLQTGGSVATSAFHYAASHGAGSIRLIGQDLAYSENRGHSVGTPYDQEYRCAANRLKPYDTIPIRKIPPDASMTKGVNGEVPVDPLLAQFRSWFEVSLSDPENAALKERCINASESGALFAGWKHQKLSEASFEGLKDVVLPKPSLQPNPHREILLQTLSLWEDERSLLQREYLYKESLQKKNGEECDAFLLARKIKRMRRTIRKIRGDQS